MAVQSTLRMTGRNRVEAVEVADKTNRQGKREQNQLPWRPSRGE